MFALLTVTASLFLFVDVVQDRYSSFYDALINTFNEDGYIVFIIVFLIALLGWYVIISSSIKKSRQRPIRFHRHRREVCYFKDGSGTPTIVPWEETVAWVSIYKGFTGSGIVSNVTFGLAFPDSEQKDYWLFKRPVGIMNEGQRAWEIIRCYMEEDPEFWAAPAEDENRQTFDENRRKVREAFKRNSKPLFAMSMSDPAASYFNFFGYYLFHILCLWKLPYLVSEWDSKISMAKYPQETDEWSLPLPEEQWAKPSAELMKQKAIAEAHYAAGGTFSTLKKRLV